MRNGDVTILLYILPSHPNTIVHLRVNSSVRCLQFGSTLSCFFVTNEHARCLPTLALPPKRSRDIRTIPTSRPSPPPSVLHEACTPGIQLTTHRLCSATATPCPTVSQSLDTRLQVVWNVFHQPRHEGGVNVSLVRTTITSCFSGCSATTPKCSTLFDGCSADELFCLLFDLKRVRTSSSQHCRVHADM